MWITVGHWIYDTAPSFTIQRDTTDNGCNPPYEPNGVPPHQAFSVKVESLHPEQMSVIQSKHWKGS